MLTKTKNNVKNLRYTTKKSDVLHGVTKKSKLAPRAARTGGKLVAKLQQAGLLGDPDLATKKAATPREKILQARRRMAARMDKNPPNNAQRKFSRAAYASLSSDTF